MSLSAPRILFGVHSITPYVPSTGIFYGTAKVIGQAEVSVSGNLVELFGGSAKYSWAVAEGTAASELNITLKEYPNFLYELMLGQAPTDNAAETGGSVVAITNKNGSSAVAATGIATVLVKSGSEADVKFASYLVKVASATTVDVYAGSDVDFLRGTDATYQNDLLKITASPLTIVASTATDIPGTGLKLTGGAGTIGMTTGDTAVFSSRPINTKSMDVTIGATGTVNPEFGCLIVGEKVGSGEMIELDVFKCKGNGFPMGFGEKAFNSAALKIKSFYDSTKNGIFKMRHVTPSSF